MCRLGFILIIGALALLTNLQRADSFSHNRLNTPALTHDVDSLEQNDDSNEGTTIQPETSIAQSDEDDDHLNSEESKIVKRDNRFLTAIDRSSEEDLTTTTESPFDSRSDEQDDVVLVKLVKRDIDHSVEDDATTEAADQSDEHDIESEEKTIKKRHVHQTAKTIFGRIDSSEEDTTDGQFFDSRSDEHSDEKRVVKRNVLQARGDRSSEEDTTESATVVGSHSDEHDDISLEDNRLVKRDIRLVAVKVDRSSEEDTTAARLLDNQTIEHSRSEENIVKRDVHLLASTVDHSSEEHTTDSVLDQASLEDSVEDALVRSPLDVKLLPSTALRI